MSKLSLFRQDSYSLKKSGKGRQESYLQRIRQLSQPKLRNGGEDVVGPGSYDPDDSFLSTKSKSPRTFICKSTRFKLPKLPPLCIIERKSGNIDKEIRDGSLGGSPSFSFKRTGHNLKLVENPGFPGAGQYSPVIDYVDKGCSFAKASKGFNWKKVFVDNDKFKIFDMYLWLMLKLSD